MPGRWDARVAPRSEQQVKDTVSLTKPWKKKRKTRLRLNQFEQDKVEACFIDPQTGIKECA